MRFSLNNLISTHFSFSFDFYTKKHIQICWFNEFYSNENLSNAIFYHSKSSNFEINCQSNWKFKVKRNYKKKQSKDKFHWFFSSNKKKTILSCAVVHRIKLHLYTFWKRTNIDSNRKIKCFAMGMRNNTIGWSLFMQKKNKVFWLNYQRQTERYTFHIRKTNSFALCSWFFYFTQRSP